jgi:hypothetical protein
MHLPLGALRVKRWLCGAVVVTLASASACQRSSGGVREGERLIFTPTYQRLWSRTIGEDDTLLAMPMKLALAGGTVAVVDPSVARVVGLAIQDGSVQWGYTRPGSGPGEFREPSDVTSADDSTLLVIDPRNGTAVALSIQGRYREQFPLAAPNLRSVCMQRKGRLVGFQVSLGPTLVAMSLADGSATALPAPWPVPVPRPEAAGTELGEFVRLTQGLLAPAGPGLCVVARQTAPGIALVKDDSVAWVNNEISGPPVDSLRDAASTAVSVGVARGEVAVAYHGIGARRGRLIDWYDLYSGRYLRSWQAPDRISWMAINDSVLVVLHHGSTSSRISAWRLPRATPD